MDRISGYIDKIVYRNEENGYTVLETSGTEAVTMVGIMPYVSVGEYITAEGTRKEHPVYGEQLSVETFEITMPENAAAAEMYLASGAVKGIGAQLAARIVRRFGDDTMRILEEEPERLAEIRGISEKKAIEIGSQISEKRDLRQAMMFLQQYGITRNLAVRIYQAYGPALYGVVRENPYRLAEDVQGVGFKTCDDLAKKIGIRPDSDFRVRSAILYVLQEALGEGHVFLPKKILTRRTLALLGEEAGDPEKQLSDMVIERKLVIRPMPPEEAPRETPDERDLEAYYQESLEPEEERLAVYASRQFLTELSVARMLTDLAEVRYEEAPSRIAAKLARLSEELEISLDPQQEEAVETAVRSGLMILTGGPGTGKTTTIRTMISYFEDDGLEVLLAAPTGRAAKRMTEAAGREAKTIHRLLEVTGGPEEASVHLFGRNEENPLEADVIILDEMSMVDMFLMSALLKAVPAGTRLILVGDADQLPSVGPGNVLGDMIASGAFPVVRLRKIFRQEEAGDIVTNAHRIRDGLEVDLTRRSRDFLFIRRPDAQSITGACLTLLREKLPPYVKAGERDIQILTPMRKGPLGVEQLNRVLQQSLNPPSPDKKERQSGETVFREGDKVMQIRNNYQMAWEVRGRYGVPVDAGMGVFNGDTGVIKEINPFTEELTVEFDDRREVTYAFKQLEELELAYAVTIHKAQGSEYPAVIVPLLSGPRMLMNRNLLYTAVTRARRCVCLVGLPETFYSMAANTTVQKRFTGLAQRIREMHAGPGL